MKGLSLTELHDLLRGPAFGAWWSEWREARAAEAEAGVRAADLAAQASLMAHKAALADRAGAEALVREGERAGEADRLDAEADRDENRGLERVSAFESQRQKASDAWLGEKQGYGEEARRRDALWGETEAAWRRSAELRLRAAECRRDAARSRSEGERQLAEAEERRARARSLESQARAARAEREDGQARRGRLLDRARAALGCLAGERYLYWPQAGDPVMAWAVPLDEEPGGEGPPPLSVWAVDPRNAPATLTPPAEGGGEVRGAPAGGAPATEEP